MKIFKYFWVGISLSLSVFSILCKAEDSISFTTSVRSSWDLWNIYPFKYYSNKLYLCGNTEATLISNLDNYLVKLYFGITSSADGNFNYMYDKDILLYGNLYIDTNLSINSGLKIGFMPDNLTRTSIIAQRKYVYSFPLLALYRSYTNVPVFDGSYMQSNHAFSINYSKILYLGNNILSISYIPNLDFNISSNNSFYKKIQKHLGAANIALNFYDECNDIGYGIIGAARLYYKDFIIPKGAEAFISPNIDYLGFGVSLSFLLGFISGMDYNFRYQLTEVSLCYKIAQWAFIGSYGYNYINGYSNYSKYYYNTFNLGMDYKIHKNFYIKANYFYNKTKNYEINQGLALAININI